LARANLLISMKNAMNRPIVAAETPGLASNEEPIGEGLPSPDGQGVAPKPRSLKGRLFGKITDYARRYITASVEHRLTLVQGRLDEVSAHNERQEHLTNHLLTTIEAQGLAIDALMRTQVQNDAKSQLALGQLENSLGRLSAFLGQVDDNLKGLPGLFGPRFDEIEVKIRPLVAFDEDSYAIRLRDGYAMVPRSEPVFAVMVANATSEGLEPGTRRVLQALIEPGMVVADVGANVGLLTLACAVATGPTGRVYAFEPEAGPRSQLEKTRHLNGLRWVEVSACAVGAQTEVKTFNVSPVIGHSSLYALPVEDGVGREVSVQVTKLDDVVEKGSRLDVVKIDVEGAELDVLAGMSRLLSENAEIAIVAEYGPSHLARIGIAPKAWLGAFKDAGFEAYQIAEPTGVCRKVTAQDLKDVISVNLAFVRPRSLAQKRLPK